MNKVVVVVKIVKAFWKMMAKERSEKNKCVDAVALGWRMKGMGRSVLMEVDNR